jgi:hypothetical protein
MADVRLVVLALVCASPAAATEFPYSAKVVVPQAEVFSGPGRQHYPTDRLSAGQTVEVHRVEPGGWCAIRPPAGSFSWVEGRFLAAAPGQDNAILRVTADDVPSYIGSRLGAERSACRVRLRRDELVESVGDQFVTGKAWHKIAPPAGEFRWIEAAQITAQITEQGSTVGRPKSGIGSRKSEMKSAPSDTNIVVHSSVRPEPVDDPRELRAGISKYTPAGHAIVAARLGAAVEHEGGEHAAPSAPSISDELRQVEVQLSLTLAQDASRWDLDEPRRVAEDLLERAMTTAERDAVRAMLAKLARLDSIQQRRQGTKGASAARPALLPPLSANHNRDSVSSPTDEESRYDGVGRLREIVSRNVAAAPFALVDDDERVQTYVSPAPGVNLRAHVGQRVGIYGIGGVVADRGQRHLTAQRIMPLSDPRRR